MASHLTRQQLEELKAALQQRQVELRTEIGEELLRQENELYVDLAGQVHDLEEESVADLLVDLNLAAIDRHVTELNLVEAALTRMQHGTYGICVDTQQPIPYQRLQAAPAAARTVEAQARLESRQPGRPHSL